MKNLKLSDFWNKLNASYWFLPSVMMLGSISLASVTLLIDRLYDKDIKISWIYTGGPDGARELVSVIASSMIAIAATAFSVTIVALQLASTSFGPRLLRSFMRDRGNQFVLGTFIAIYIYCLLVLRTIRGEDYELFVPQLSVTISIVLAIVSALVLIYFIHHASTMIQASHVISSVSEDLDRAVDRLFPEKLGRQIPDREKNSPISPDNFPEPTRSIRARKTGYLQMIDEETLLKIACRQDLIFFLKARPGKFILEGDELLLVHPTERENRDLEKKLDEAFIFGKERTDRQDIEFSIEQLVEVSLRAMSPGINDPFTAIRCIDRLGAGLSRLAGREFPSPYRHDDAEKLRVIVSPVNFESLVRDAFGQLSYYSRHDPVVTLRLMEAIATVATRARKDSDRLALQREAERIRQTCQENLQYEHDRGAIERVYRQIIGHLYRTPI